MSWRRTRLTWEEDLEQQLLQQIRHISCRRNAIDSWVGNEEVEGNYSVKTAYNVIQDVINIQESEVLKQLWSLKVLSTALNICWKTVLDRVPVKKNLEKRRISLSNNMCPLCQEQLETINHLFITCMVVQRVWDICDRWVGVNLVRQIA